MHQCADQGTGRTVVVTSRRDGNRDKAARLEGDQIHAQYQHRDKSQQDKEYWLFQDPFVQKEGLCNGMTDVSHQAPPFEVSFLRRISTVTATKTAVHRMKRIS